jgi:hypothetical protein
MALPNDLIEKIKQLPERDRMAVRTLVDELARGTEKRPDKPTDWLGCLGHLHVTLGEEDIAAARQEMWANFPRDVPQ